jgi:hypothetical protein
MTKLIARALVLGILLAGTSAIAGPSTSTTTPAKTHTTARKVVHKKKGMKKAPAKTAVAKPAPTTPAKAPAAPAK